MYIDKNGERYYKVGLHTHTTVSDGLVSPQEMARIYKNAGYDAVAMTEHWKYTSQGEIDGLKIISGCEYNIDIDGTMHIVGIGMKTSPQIDIKTATRQGVIDAIRACGGMAVLAHPAWSLNDKQDVKELHGFSFVEIYNTVSDVVMSNRPDSSYLIDSLACDGVVIPLIATDDVHYYNGQDDTRSFVMVKAKSGEIDDILEALKNGEYYSSQGPYLKVTRVGNTVVAECSPCKKIAFMSNAVWTSGRMVRADAVERAEYTPQSYESWLRVEVTDQNGNRAWSNILKL